VKTLCAKAQEILMEESNVQRVDAPVTVRRTTAATRAPVLSAQQPTPTPTRLLRYARRFLHKPELLAVSPPRRYELALAA
jgi:hypothetical protein